MLTSDMFRIHRFTTSRGANKRYSNRLHLLPPQPEIFNAVLFRTVSFNISVYQCMRFLLVSSAIRKLRRKDGCWLLGVLPDASFISRILTLIVSDSFIESIPSNGPLIISFGVKLILSCVNELTNLIFGIMFF